MLYFVSLVSFSSDLGWFCEQKRILFYQDRIAKPDSRDFAEISPLSGEERGLVSEQRLVIQKPDRFKKRKAQNIPQISFVIPFLHNKLYDKLIRLIFFFIFTFPIGTIDMTSCVTPNVIRCITSANIVSLGTPVMLLSRRVAQYNLIKGRKIWVARLITFLFKII